MRLLGIIFLFFFALSGMDIYGQNYESYISGYDRILEGDSVIVITDTIRTTDTIIQYVQSEKKFTYSIRFSISIFEENYKYRFVDGNYKIENKSIHGFEPSIYLQVNRKQYFASIGLSYFLPPGELPHMYWKINKISTPQMFIDTIAKWNHIYENKDSLIYETDTTYFYKRDSNLLSNPYIFNLPVLFGVNYAFNKNISYDFYCGFVNSVLMFPEKQYSYLKPGENAELKREGYLNALLLSVEFGASIKIRKSDNLGMSMGFLIKKPVVSTLDRTYIKNWPIWYGLNLGICLCW